MSIRDIVVTEDNWNVAFGLLQLPDTMTYDEFIRPVEEEKERRQLSYGNRPEIFRMVFHEVTDGGVTNETLKKFYTSDIMARLCASEFGRPGITLAALVEEGLRKLQAMCIPFEESVDFVFLDHGFGNGCVGLAVLEKYPNATVYFYDYTMPHRLALMMALRQDSSVSTRARFRFIDKSEYHFWEREGAVRFDFVSSLDVLEHVKDPVGEIVSIRKGLNPGGHVAFYTFFNSDNGRDPSHLKENEYLIHGNLWSNTVVTSGYALRTDVPQPQRGNCLFVRV